MWWEGGGVTGCTISSNYTSAKVNPVQEITADNICQHKAMRLAINKISCFVGNLDLSMLVSFPNEVIDQVN